ncbi:transcription initiation factor TFIID subunit 9 [Agrilus planipennis]|uniref:Transcription initiation factor TFIID subunit 9 n=1 Tax=Agrilus planipennis TaxID=224129 RepID=A0A1W4WK67_AGRPL|nr:transcription initiation factor TFIID subunit 9 [Agrilus planipennis]
MSDKEKQKMAQQSKNIPKDGQVIMSIMKEMGITEYEPKTIIQLTDFVYRYATSNLEEARNFANNCKKKFIDLDDIRLALQLSSESSFTTPPPREAVLECARNKSNTPLPIIKPHCGLRLPPDRHCLAAPNYTLKYPTQKKTGKITSSVATASSGIKIMTRPAVSYIKRSTIGTVQKQTVTIPRTGDQKTVLKPRIQITQNIQVASPSTNTTAMEVDHSSLKRKREDEENI